MSATKKHKRKPFGTNAANDAIVSKKHSVHKAQQSKSRSELRPAHHGRRKAPRNKSKQDGRRGAASTVADNNQRKRPISKEKIGPDAAKRRDSKTPRTKTPKTSNLSAAGANLTNEFDSCRPRNKPKQHKRAAGHHSATKPDPSPIKRPDPLSSNALPSKSQTKRPKKSTKRDGDTKRDGFVSVSFKRLFPTKESTKKRFSAQRAKYERPDEPNDTNPPGTKHASSDMDTTCSTLEKNSPLIKSPLAKLEPIAKGVENAVVLERKGEIRKRDKPDATAFSSPEKNSPLIKSPLAKLEPIAKDVEDAIVLSRNEEMRDHDQPDVQKPPAPKSQLSSFEKEVKPPAAPQKVAQKERDTTSDQPRSVSKEMLNRAKYGPTDNQRVLEAMFNSGNGKSNPRPKPAEYKPLPGTLVGSYVGGVSLRRSSSLDESEVTTIDFRDDSSHASMTTRADHGETARVGNSRRNNAPSQNGGSVSGILRNKASSHGATDNSNGVPSQQHIRHVNAAEAQQRAEQIPYTEYAQPHSTQLPAGWKVRWSRTKQKPYYVHPDFGSTWHCPGFVVNNGQVAIPNKFLYDDQRFDGRRIFLGRSQDALNASQMPNRDNQIYSKQNSNAAHSAYDVKKSVDSNDDEHSFSMSKSVGTSHKAPSVAAKSRNESNADEHSSSMSNAIKMEKSTNTACRSYQSNADDRSMHKSIDVSHIARSAQGTERSFKSEFNNSATHESYQSDAGDRSMHNSTDASHMARSAQGTERRFKSKFNRSASIESADANPLGKPTAGSACGSIRSSSKSKIDTHAETKTVVGHTCRVRISEDLGHTKVARSNDGSSAEDSSGCLTQEFESNDSASARGNLEEGDHDERDNENQNQNDASMEIMEPETYHHADTVEFENNQSGGFDGSDEESQRRLNIEKRDERHLGSSHEKPDQAAAAGREKVLERIANEQNEINSLVRDHVDAEALLRNGKTMNQSPLPTIKESRGESAGCLSSEVSPDEESDDEHIEVEAPKKYSGHKNHDGGGEKSISDQNLSKELGIGIGGGTGGNSFDNGNDDYESDDYGQSLMFQNSGGANDDFDDSGSEIEADQRQPRKNLNVELKKTSKRSESGCKKKIFPPGPLCSLQFLDEIENNKFDTPLWRRMKRKRSTLASVKRSNSSMK